MSMLSMSSRKILLSFVPLIACAGSLAADEVASSVAAKLRESGTLVGYRVNVKEEAGTVWLEGTVSDQSQLVMAIDLAHGVEGVQRVVNRLSIANPHAVLTPNQETSTEELTLGMPTSVQSVVEKMLPTPSRTVRSELELSRVAHLGQAAESLSSPVQLTAATGKSQSANGAPRKTSSTGKSPRPLASTPARPISARQTGGTMRLPSPGQSSEVPGSERIIGDKAYGPGPSPGAGGPSPGGPGMGGPGMGRPMPMGSAGVGMPPIPMRGDGPNMPKYAWPSYASYPNYAALQYPTQYSPTAWPYIGPFYPYPQVPLGWRKVSLEWDDGWWFLDFDDRQTNKHH